MAEYVTRNPDAKVLGAGVISFVASLGDKIIPILDECGLYPIEAEKWYNQQTVLDAYKKINDENFMNLVAVGMSMPDQVPWPPDIESVHDALASIGVAYQMNHQGDNLGGYH
ncbi:MAG: hypothetical protein AAF126_17855, partial [Chloroflexota bacterium]